MNHTKCHISIVLFIFPILLFSQSWFTQGKEWKYKVTAGFNISNYGIHSTKVIGDTTILGKSCTKMTWYPVTTDPFNYFLYQDGKKVYHFMDYENKFELLYDFDLQVGDTLRTSITAGRVEAIGIIDIAGIPKNYQIINYFSGAFKHMLVEEMGIIGDPLNLDVNTCGQLVYTRTCLAAVDGWDYYFACYKDDDISYDPKSLCANSNVQLTEEIPFSIFPNPALDALVVVADNEALRFDIFDLLGKSVRQNLNSGLIDVSELPGGMYLLKAIINGRSSKPIKFIIQK